MLPHRSTAPKADSCVNRNPARVISRQYMPKEKRRNEKRGIRTLDPPKHNDRPVLAMRRLVYDAGAAQEPLPPFFICRLERYERVIDVYFFW